MIANQEWLSERPRGILRFSWGRECTDRILEAASGQARSMESGEVAESDLSPPPDRPPRLGRYQTDRHPRQAHQETIKTNQGCVASPRIFFNVGEPHSRNVHSHLVGLHDV